MNKSNVIFLIPVAGKEPEGFRNDRSTAAGLPRGIDIANVTDLRSKLCGHINLMRIRLAGIDAILPHISILKVTAPTAPCRAVGAFVWPKGKLSSPDGSFPFDVSQSAASRHLTTSRSPSRILAGVKAMVAQAEVEALEAGCSGTIMILPPQEFAAALDYYTGRLNPLRQTRSWGHLAACYIESGEANLIYSPHSEARIAYQVKMTPVADTARHNRPGAGEKIRALIPRCEGQGHTIPKFA
jgi:hypothetical protein